MPAQTTDGTHIITVGELLEMLAKCDPHDRIQTEFGCIDRISRAADGTVLIMEPPMTASEKLKGLRRLEGDDDE